MEIKSGFRPEDKGRMSEDDAHDLANMMLGFMRQYPEGKIPSESIETDGGTFEFPSPPGFWEGVPTAEDYTEVLQMIDDLLQAKNELERQTIFDKFTILAAKGALAILSATLGRFKKFRNLKLRPCMDLTDLREVKDWIEDFKRRGKSIAEAQIEYANEKMWEQQRNSNQKK